MKQPGAQPYRIVGRYALYGEIASGGMATVYFGRLIGPIGFSRTVAIKCLHPQYAKDPDFVSMFVDEARLAARIQHPNVVPTLDVVTMQGELFLVMDYVQGESLARLARRVRASHSASVPPRIALGIVAGALDGLHAAHEALSERGEPLGLVHRDVSPQNIMVGIDGVARVLDFGVAKATGRIQTTNDGQLKGKVSYMAPEQMAGGEVDRRTDIYAASVVLWEMLTGRRLFDGDNPARVMNAIVNATMEPPSRFVPGLSPAIDAVVMRGLTREPATRFATAREMAVAIEASTQVASTREVGDWVLQIAGESLGERAERLKEIESISTVLPPQNLDTGRSVGAVSSQDTGLSLTTNSFASKVKANKLRLAIAVGAVAAVGVIAVVWLAILAFGGGPARTEGASSSPSATVDESPKPVASPAVIASATPGDVAEPVASAEPAPSASAASKAPAPRKSVPGVTGPIAPKPPAANCNPPTWVDAKGIRHPKPECF
ncbi:MAG TPA: serine/threonine-protein kinase [Polyangiaceae bacterium]|nr:serine/threonine-protein kinase [Polyangiaceae bacterium]